MFELRGEGVPERRGGGSGVWRRNQKCVLGHWSLTDGDYTELTIHGEGLDLVFPSIYLLGRVSLEETNLFDVYVVEFFELGSPKLLASALKAVAEHARKRGEVAAQTRMRLALGLSRSDDGSAYEEGSEP